MAELGKYGKVDDEEGRRFPTSRWTSARELFEERQESDGWPPAGAPWYVRATPGAFQRLFAVCWSLLGVTAAIRLLRADDGIDMLLAAMGVVAGLVLGVPAMLTWRWKRRRNDSSAGRT